MSNGVVYIGSFDRNLYAFKANGCGRSTCPPLWKGTTGDAIESSRPSVEASSLWDPMTVC